MASGFIILEGGRCFAPQWRCYDFVLREVITALVSDLNGHEFANWLASLLPSSNDEEEIGIGAWVRKSDGEVISRHFDVRELTEANQRLFNQAARLALLRVQQASAGKLEDNLACLSHLVDLIERAEKGEPPLSLTYWTCVQPPSGQKTGTGW